MKLNEVSMGSGYLAYPVPNDARETFLHHFKPKYDKVYAHHITYQFGVPPSALDKVSHLEKIAKIKIVGYGETDGLETYIVSVNGKLHRPDGKVYHITWSIDPSSGKKPVDSNKIASSGQWTPIDGPSFISAMTYF